MPPSRDRLLLLLIPLAALLAVLPLILHGCSCGHDFDFHLLSWQEAARQFAHGNLHPRWAFAPAWGAGEPRFVFYPPLSWTIGALLTLAASALHHLPGLLHLQPAQLFAATPIVYTWLALTAAGLAMHHLARRFVSPSAALLAAILYLANPYTLFTAYERTAFAELLAAAWLPLLLAALLPNPREPHSPLSILRTAIPLALLWLTNAPAAVIGSYALALIVALRLLPLLRTATTRRVPHRAPLGSGSAGRQIAPTSRKEALALALRAIAATALALALAAFYILPAVLERPWVSIRMAILPGLRPDDNTLFHHTADPAHDAVLLTASHLAVTLLTITLIALTLTFLRQRARRRILNSPALDNNPGYLRTLSPDTAPAALLLPAQPSILPILATLTLAIAFLLTPASLPLWHHLPELAFLQFPWRLLALLAPICALSLALALPIFPRQRSSRPDTPTDLSSGADTPDNVSSRPKRSGVERPAVALALPLLAAALILPAYTTFHQPCDPEDTPQARYTLFRTPTGDEPTDEYTPATADNDALKDNNPGYRLLPSTASDDSPPAPDANTGAAPLTLNLNLPAPAILVLNLRDYPTWQVERNGALEPDHMRRADGLLTLALPAGPEHLRLTQHTPPAELAADALSAVTLLLSLALSLRQRQNARDMIKPS